MSDLRAIMQKCELFQDLSEESLERIASQFQRVFYEKGAVICHEGETADSMYMIVSGEVSVLKNMGWGQRELRRTGSNEVFGEMGLISKDARAATVRVLEATECLRLGGEGFTTLLRQDPSFAQRVALLMTRRLSSQDQKNTSDLLGAYRALILALADLTDSRDPETGAHIERTRNYCVLLAEKLAAYPRYAERMGPGFLEELFQVAPLHDIGKVAIPDAILLKPARLAPLEYEVMKTHARVGAAALQRVIGQCANELFRTAYRICLHHHEKWDGTGYPARLAGDAIPLEARIMAMADVYDALLSRRVYKPAMSYEATREEIRRGGGTGFDPFMTEVMLEHMGLFEEIHKKHQDGETQ